MSREIREHSSTLSRACNSVRALELLALKNEGKIERINSLLTTAQVDKLLHRRFFIDSKGCPRITIDHIYFDLHLAT